MALSAGFLRRCSRWLPRSPTSDRSTCRRCLRRIGRGELRCGIRTRVPMFGHSFVAWHHARCVRMPGGSLLPEGAEVRGLVRALGVVCEVLIQIQRSLDWDRSR